MSLKSIEIPIVKTPVETSVRVPGSKSLTNRALLAAALAKGESKLTGCLYSVDTDAMITNLGLLGIKITCAGQDEVHLEGSGGNFAAFDGSLNCVNAGTATRFLTAAMTIVPGTQTVDGNARMRERPILDLVEALKPLGTEIECPTGCPPVTIKSGSLRGGTTKIPGNVSSQFLSALLLVTPYAQEPTEISVIGELVSKPYVDLTLDIVEIFGGNITNQDYHTFQVEPVRYSAFDYAVEADVSSACYWFALAAATASKIQVRGVRRESRQADIRVLDVLEQMGAQVESGADSVTVTGPSKLKAPGVVDMVDFSDQVMTIAVLAAMAEGETTIANVEVVRHKETDRLAATANELNRAGIQVNENQDSLVITGGVAHGAQIQTYDDHRMAMSFAILGTRTPGIEILDPGCVSKTYPAFFEELFAVLQKQ